VATFTHEGRRLSYTEFGSGPRVTILLPGLLLSQSMQFPLARSLAARGHRVVTLDFLGHGESDRPCDMTLYSMTEFGAETVALMDHLELDEAVVGGTSLGANVTLEVAALAGDRLRGMVVEMPVLDNALLGCAVAFTPMMIALTAGEPLMRIAQRAARLVPRGGVPDLLNLGLDWLRQDPAPSGAVLQGLFFGRIAPHRDLRRTFEAPALVIGHPRDPVHPFSDADALARELPNGRLIDASSILELRLFPERLTGEIAAFVDDCWSDRRAPARPARRRRVAS
jgi:pimeloyl-ACP methyl ester carboxylesterase